MAGGTDQQRRLLYYFAPLSDVDDIVARRRIPPGSSIRSGLLARVPLPRRFRLVWLTDAAELTGDQAAGVTAVRPGLVQPAEQLARFTLSVTDAQYWPRWARRNGIGRRRRRRLDAATGGLSGRAWVVTRAIAAAEWVRVDALRGGRVWPSDGEIDRHAVPTQFPALPVFRRPGVDWPASSHPARARPRPSPSR